MCIPLSKVCDKHPDCPNFEDEPRDRCGENECAKNNGGCTQKCVDTPVGYYCDCEKGYKLVDNRTCEGEKILISTNQLTMDLIDDQFLTVWMLGGYYLTRTSNETKSS